MCREVFDVADECINHEMCVFGRNVLHNDLDDMVAILITDTIENVIFELINHGGLLMNKNMLESLEKNELSIAVFDSKLTVCTTLHPYTWQDSSYTFPDMTLNRAVF